MFNDESFIEASKLYL